VPEGSVPYKTLLTEHNRVASAFSPEGRTVAVCDDRMSHLWLRKAFKGTGPNVVPDGANF